MSVEVRKKVTKITQTGTLLMLMSTIVVAIFFVFILRFSEWFVIPCIVIQIVLTLFFYKQCKRIIERKLQL